MNSVLNILKNVGEGVISAVVPGAAPIIGLVNQFLPDDKKLPSTATGTQALSAISTLPPEQQSQILTKQYEVQIEAIDQSGKSLQAMLAADATTPHTTRPLIALIFAWVVAICTSLLVGAISYAVVQNDADMLSKVGNAWPVVAAAMLPIVRCLQAYFGILKVEHANKLAAISNQPAPPTGLSAAIGSLVKAFKG